MNWTLLLGTIAVMGLAVLALSVRILFKKDGRFLHRCAMSDIDFGDGQQYDCGHCTVPPGGRHEDCPRFQLHHGTAATQTLEALKMIEHEEQ